jgi:hypothetical protein
MFLLKPKVLALEQKTIIKPNEKKQHTPNQEACCGNLLHPNEKDLLKNDSCQMLAYDSSSVSTRWRT